MESVSILAYLLFSNEYLRKVGPHLKKEYFIDRAESIVFTNIWDHFTTYNRVPTLDEISINVSKSSVSDETIKQIDELFSSIEAIDVANMSFENMFKNAEEFAQERALLMALSKSIEIKNGKENVLTKTAIPDLLQKALAVNFDQKLGHDFWDDYQDRYEYYTAEDLRFPFDIAKLNELTNGGVPKATLNILLAGTNVGKTLAQCSLASSYITMGKNVLYVSGEESEEQIAKRIDANILNYPINDLDRISKERYEKLVFQNKSRPGMGKLKIVRYAPQNFSAHTISLLLEELKLKNQFVPDVIFVDYIGCVASMRIKNNGSTNTNTLFKNVSEELRALFIKYDVIGWTAHQYNRGGYSSSDPDLTDIADAFAINQVADFILSLSTTDQLDELGQILCRILKSRYNKKGSKEKRTFILNIDYDHMRLSDAPNMTPSTKIPSRKPVGRNSFNGLLDDNISPIDYGD